MEAVIELLHYETKSFLGTRHIFGFPYFCQTTAVVWFYFLFPSREMLKIKPLPSANSILRENMLRKKKKKPKPNPNFCWNSFSASADTTTIFEDCTCNIIFIPESLLLMLFRFLVFLSSSLLLYHLGAHVFHVQNFWDSRLMFLIWSPGLIESYSGCKIMSM